MCVLEFAYCGNFGLFLSADFLVTPLSFVCQIYYIWTLLYARIICYCFWGELFSFCKFEFPNRCVLLCELCKID